jgi:hypothetical protein
MVKTSVVIAATAAALCCAGIASADDQYNGQTYAEVKETLSATGTTSKIGSTVGDELPIGQCVVTGSQTNQQLGSSGATGAKEVVLDLNCNRTAATAGQPDQGAQQGGQAESGSQTGG